MSQLRLEDIAVKLDIYDAKGNRVHTYVVMHHDELLISTIGRGINQISECDEMIKLMRESLQVGLESPWEIYWYVVGPDDQEIDYNDVSNYALKNGASIVIIDRE